MKNQIIFPRSLKKGDKIAIISPAGSVDKSQLTSTLSLIEKNGFIPVFGRYSFGKYECGYSYSGTEQERILDFNWAFNADDVSAIWATRGGYGCQHLLEHINLKNFKKNPKWFIGYSDNTVIQSFLVNNGFASIHGQTIKTSDFGISVKSYKTIFEILNGNFPSYNVESHHYNKEGSSEGVLIGGNLALVYALLGTKYSVDFEDKILFIEDIGENFYALDRMLMSLDLAGVFKKIKGLIIGGMTNMGNSASNSSYQDSFDDYAYHIIKHRLEKYHFPTLFQFPNGHIFENLPLIIGSKIKLNIDSKESSITIT